MNRLALVAAAVTLCVAILIIGLSIYLDNKPSPSAKPIINVTVTSFNLTGYYNPVGVVWNDMFLLTYANNGTTNIDNTTITFSTNSTFEMSREIDVFEPAPNLNNSIRSFVMGEPYFWVLSKPMKQKKSLAAFGII